MSRYFNKKNYKNFIILIVLVLSIVVSGRVINYYSKSKIERVLESSSYDYLPKAAQNYIKDVYEETGEVLLTEENKEVNKPYLNPKYVTYLQLSDEEKESVSIIPNPYTVDYVFGKESSNQEFPSAYNLENINGNNYTSPMYNQGDLGTCWAFATVQNAESHLMIKKNEPRNENSTRFSVRQLDYAASEDGIKDYENPWGVAPLALGGNFVYATTLMANGLSLVADDYMPYEETVDQKPLHEIHNYSNSLYEVNGTANLPNFGKIDLIISQKCEDVDDWEACYEEVTNQLEEEYINIIKDGITNYGGIYLGAYDPTGSCGTLNSDGYYVLDPNHTCFPVNSTKSADEAHAMQIIGWDDDYEYSYCQGRTHSSTVDGVCESGVLTQGTGAWLVKNSWGENNTPYSYLTYNSIRSNFVDFAYITSMSEMSERNWDNVYNNGKISSSVVYKLTQTFDKKLFNKEKIQKIKFHTILMNEEYSISVVTNGNTYLITDSFKTEYPGLYTVDVTDKDIFIQAGDFEVIIEGTEQSINKNSISVFTKNMDSMQYILSEEKNVDSNKFILYSDTRNIPSNTVIEYELYKGDEKLENVLEVKNNKVAANNINAEILLTKKLEPGTYNLVQMTNDIKVTRAIYIGTILDGAGTKDNPFKIYTEDDLKYINTHLDSYYKLENDIELTEEWVPIGTKDNPFTGAFDGNNHKIINLKIDDSTLEYAGLFGYVKDSDEHQTYIKNIYLVNPNIVADYYAGGLIGYIYITQTGTKSALIDSIYIIGGNIEGKQASGLVANIFGTFNQDLTINNIFSSATIKGKIKSSLIGMHLLGNDTGNNKGVSISNIQNIGVMYDNGVTSLINANSSVNAYSLSNYISTGYSKKGNSINQFYDTPVHDIDDVDETKGYVLSRADSTYTFPSIIKKVTDITELKNTSKYSDWGDDFNTYWEIKEEDGVTRIPTLKDVDLDYTESIDDINVEFGNDIALSDYISSELITRRLNVTTEDNDIIEISKEYNPSEAYPHEIIISPLKQGTATIHVVSDYDGYEDDVSINVSKTNLTITYHNGTETSIQNVTNGTAVNLIKNTFEKEHHIFKEWNTKADGTGIPYSDEQEVTITEDLDLYAIWEENTYKISFDANGGTGTMDDINVIVDDYMDTSVPYSKFTKEGYKVTSWNTEPDGSGKGYLQGGVIAPTGDTILYAQREAKQYNVKYYYKLNDVVGTIKTVLFTYDTETELLDAQPDEEGYKFVYWGTKEDGTGTNYLPKQKVKNLSTGSDVTLYTIFSPITYKVVFNSNDGTSMTSEQIFTYDEEQLLKSNTYTKEGFNFKEWNTKADGTGTPYTNEQTVKNLATEDNAIINLYAIWDDQEYSVTLDANEGRFADNKTTFVIENWENSKLESLEIPTRNGYTFKGYYTEKTGGTSLENYITETGIKEDGLIFYAQWEINKYTLKFNANGGTGAMNDQEFVHDTSQRITKNAYTREGFKFKEWNTKADGTGTAYTNEKEIKLSDDLTLYAIWEETYSYIINKYSIDESNKYVDLIEINTSVDEFKKNIEVNDGYRVEVDYKLVNGKNLLYTGGKTKIYKNNELIIEYTNIIRGEVNGDGKISALDYVKVKNHIMKANVITDNIYMLAADANVDDKISALDYVRIKNTIMEENS